MEEAIRKDGFSSSALNLFTVQYCGPLLSQKSFCRGFCKKKLFSVFVSEQKGEGASGGVLIVTPHVTFCPRAWVWHCLEELFSPGDGSGLSQSILPWEQSVPAQPGVTLVGSEGLLSCLCPKCHARDSALSLQLLVEQFCVPVHGEHLCPWLSGCLQFQSCIPSACWGWGAAALHPHALLGTGARGSGSPAATWPAPRGSGQPSATCLPPSATCLPPPATCLPPCATLSGSGSPAGSSLTGLPPDPSLPAVITSTFV